MQCSGIVVCESHSELDWTRFVLIGPIANPKIAREGFGDFGGENFAGRCARTRPMQFGQSRALKLHSPYQGYYPCALCSVG